MVDYNNTTTYSKLNKARNGARSKIPQSTKYKTELDPKITTLTPLLTIP